MKAMSLVGSVLMLLASGFASAAEPAARQLSMVAVEVRSGV